jgi:hypothetical protein
MEFLVSKPAHVNESLRSYISRVARANVALEFVRDELASITAAAAYYPTFLDLIPAQHWIAASQLELPLFREGSETVIPINDGRVHESVFRGGFRAVCPKCIARTSATPMLWEFDCIRACSLHQCALITKCPACRKQISWVSRRDRACNCGFRLSAAPSVHAGAATTLISEILYELVYLPRSERQVKWRPVIESVGTISLEWFLLLIAVIKELLLPRFLGCPTKHLENRWGQALVDDVMLEMLDDEDYVFSLRGALFLHAARSPHRLVEIMLPRGDRAALEENFGAALEDFPRHPSTYRFRTGASYRWQFVRGSPKLVGPPRRPPLFGEARGLLIRQC